VFGPHALVVEFGQIAKAIGQKLVEAKAIGPKLVEQAKAPKRLDKQFELVVVVATVELQ
jgi:hypothetical protein